MATVPSAKWHTITAVHSAASPTRRRRRTERAADRARSVPVCATRPLIANPAAVHPTASTGSEVAIRVMLRAATTAQARAAKRATRCCPARLRTEYSETRAPIPVTSVSSVADTAVRVRFIPRELGPLSASVPPPVDPGAPNTTSTREASAATVARHNRAATRRRSFIRQKIHEKDFAYKIARLKDFRVDRPR